MAAALGAGLAACTSPEQKRQANLYQDKTTCGDFGARQGTPEYTECMLTQQNRRDHEKLNALERQRLSIQMSKDSMEMTRKVQCDRDAKKDKEAGLRPRRCD
ncbi:hypothetical protein [Paucibacter sp. M5-1]|uniref:hypothetical protein n=1 Tax=Paucibacter sp. M5-1 TaxID=3015998 RepID=UPI0022B8F537|nr:hypothetical protein [Paucibacter sp. M5-1]MCZ7880474.1 hypothetical protein [Paucibacter sp. M5-1]